VQQEQPDVVNGYLLDFLADLSPDAHPQPALSPDVHGEAGGLQP
jgi:hypothetical protein